MIPIYLADTIRLPEPEVKPTLWMQLPSYRVELDGREIFLPEPLLQNLALYDQAIELAKEFARQNKGKSVTLELFRNFCTAQHFSDSDDDALVRALYTIMEALKHFIDKGRDTIWAFVLKNIYKPLFLKGKFDFVLGNPPWIAFRFMEPAYQAFLKRQITKEYKLLTGHGELIPHLEVATLFFVRAADLYLKAGGAIAFVLPRSLFSADQHDGLRNRAFKFSEDEKNNLSWLEVWDCENVEPLFNVPACVLMAEKGETSVEGRSGASKIAGQILSGKLDRKNASIIEAEKTLEVENVDFSLHIRGKRSFWTTEKDAGTKGTSFYKTFFFQGATIVPRSFWFVKVNPSPLGFNPDLPPLETADRARQEAKDDYKSVLFKDAVESHFLYVTLLSTDLLPFGHLDYRLVLLPIELAGGRYKLIGAGEAHKWGFLHLARWLEKAEGEWAKRRGTKAKGMSIYERLDRVHGLTRQSPQAKYRVTYNKSGTFLTAAVIKNVPIEFEINGQEIKAQGFLADYVTYYFETSIPDEAYYLSAILNAPKTDALIKPMQARGLWGPRDIVKKVFELSIPQFDPTNLTHRRLAELGRECSTKVKRWLAGGGAGNIKSIGRLRAMVREMLKDELNGIDALVKEILR